MDRAKDSLRIRVFPESNYKAIYVDGKTLRIPLDKQKPITELEYPEFLDVAITSYCQGSCPFCYMNATESGKHVENVVEKIEDMFGTLTMNQRPMQVALGGSGNPNEHPDFIEVLKKFDELGITPNFTTNGMGLTEKILDAAHEYCGGVAVSCHPHLHDIWTSATRRLLDKGIATSLHHIIYNRSSVDRFLDILNGWPEVKYHVLLPLVGQGRATSQPIENDYLFEKLGELPEDILSRVAFGAKFYDQLVMRRTKFNVSLYEPESLSKYVDMVTGKIYRSSFDA